MTLHVHARGRVSTDDLQWLVAQAHLWHESTAPSQRPRNEDTAHPLGYTPGDRPASIYATAGGALVVTAGRVGGTFGGDE